MGSDRKVSNGWRFWRWPHTVFKDYLAGLQSLFVVFGILVAFLIYNLQEALGGRWELGESPTPGVEEFRKIIGLFAMVQGFEAARYIGIRFSAERPEAGRSGRSSSAIRSPPRTSSDISARLSTVARSHFSGRVRSLR